MLGMLQSAAARGERGEYEIYRGGIYYEVARLFAKKGSSSGAGIGICYF